VSLQVLAYSALLEGVGHGRTTLKISSTGARHMQKVREEYIQLVFSNLDTRYSQNPDSL
jgi:hypothetical protein